MPSKTFDMVASNTLEVIGSPFVMLPGMQPIVTLNVAGTGTLSGESMLLYKGSKDVSSTNLSGASSISGRAITCKQITALTPGEWILYILYSDNGIPDERFMRFTVIKRGI